MKTRAETKKSSSSNESKKKITRHHIAATPDKRRFQDSSKANDKYLEAKLKTPKCEQRKEVQQTPLRDDFICSQHFDSQVVVGWDCNSPNTIRGLRKLSGDEDNGISDLVKLIADEPEDFLPRRSTPPLLGIWKKDKEDQLLERKNAGHKVKKRGRSRRKSAKDSVVSKEFLKKLEHALDKCAEPDKETDQRIEEVELFVPEDDEAEQSQQDNSKDLFESNMETNTFENNLDGKVRVSPRLLEKNKPAKDMNVGGTFSLEKRRVSLEADVTWSDDELFGEDSFIIKATQFPTDTMKFTSPVFGMKRKTLNDGGLPKSKCSRYTFQLGGENDKTSQNTKDCVSTDKSNCFTNISSKLTIQNTNNLPVIPDSSVPPINNSSRNNEPRIGNVFARQNKKTPLYQKPNSAGQCFPNSSNQYSYEGQTPSTKSVPSTSGAQSIKTPAGNSSIHDRGTKKCNIQTFTEKAKFVSKETLVYSSSTSETKSCVEPTLDTNRNIVASQISSFCAVSSVSINSSEKTTVLNASAKTGKNFYMDSAPHKTQTNINRSGSFKKHYSFSGQEMRDKQVGFTRQRSMSGNTKFSPILEKSTRNIGAANVMQFGTDSHQKTKCCTTIRSRQQTNLPNSLKQDAVSQRKSVAASFSLLKSANDKLHQNIDTATSASSTSNTNSNGGKLKSSPESTASIYTEKQKRRSTSGFDTSLSDDLLCQLAEPDDILDSQMYNTVHIEHVKPAAANIPIGIKQTANVCDQKQFSDTAQKSSNVLDITNRQHRTSQRLVKSMKTSDSKGHVQKGIMDSAPKLKPEKRNDIQQTDTKISAVVSQFDAYSEDLFTSDDDDVLLGDEDDFLRDDDGLTEPQIFAMLDEAELIATQQLQSTSSPSLNHALEQVDVTSEPVVKLNNSEGQSSSQGQQTSSQTKYSPAEIEKKKREAQERRQKRLRNT